jgi:putative ABC transport system substrate-binding protein
MDRRTFMVSLAGGLLTAPLAANGLPQGKTARVGFLVTTPRETMPRVVATIVDRLRELGYVEGRNVIFDFRHADSEERFWELAAQLVGAGIQVIFAQGPYALREAHESAL